MLGGWDPAKWVAPVGPGPGSYKHHPNSLAKAIRNKLEAQLSSQWEGPTNVLEGWKTQHQSG